MTVGDDQDGLRSTIIELMSMDKHRARVILDELRATGSPEIQRHVMWAYELLDSGLFSLALRKGESITRCCAMTKRT